MHTINRTVMYTLISATLASGTVLYINNNNSYSRLPQDSASLVTGNHGVHGNDIHNITLSESGHSNSYKQPPRIEQSNDALEISNIQKSQTDNNIVISEIVLQLNESKHEIEELKSQLTELKSIVDNLQFNSQNSTIIDQYVQHSEFPDEQQLALMKWEEHDNDEISFADQDYNSSWSIEIEESLRTRLSSDVVEGIPEEMQWTIPGDILDTLECRSNTCRMEIASSENMDRIQEQFMLRTAGLFTAISVHHTDTGSAVMFLGTE